MRTLQFLICVLVAQVGATGPLCPAQAAQQPVLHANSGDLPSLSTQTMIGDACSAATPNNQPPIAVRWHYQRSSGVTTSWMRAHLIVKGSTELSWHIDVRDGGGSLRQTLVAADFVDGDAWTVELPSSMFSLDMVSDKRIPIVICVDAISVSSSQVVLTSKAVTSPDGKPRWISLVSTDPDYTYRKSVAIVWFLKPDGTKTNCSGFAITTTEVITNYHCLYDPKQLKYVEIGFLYESGVPQYLSRKATRFASLSSKSLDYSVLELDHPLSDDFVSTIRTSPVAAEEALILIQHPDGLRKMIVTNGCVVSSLTAPDSVVAGSDYSHKCDSTGGSSGAPLMDVRGYVVGLHHLEQYDDSSASYYNMAVYTSKLLDDLNGNSDGRTILAKLKKVPKNKAFV